MFHCRIFIGYRGVGKSTIINCLEQRVLFKSGDGYKCDLKHHLQEMDCNGITYMEICFKNDTEQIEEVAQKTNEVVKQNIKYQIFFVVETKNQEIREKDLNAIQLVLEKTKNISYNLIINKLPIPVFKKFCKDETLIFPDGRRMKQVSYLLLQHEEILKDAKDKLLKLEHLEKFVGRVSAISKKAPGNDTSFLNNNS